jgi:hypothetical protein
VGENESFAVEMNQRAVSTEKEHRHRAEKSRKNQIRHQARGTTSFREETATPQGREIITEQIRV